MYAYLYTAVAFDTRYPRIYTIEEGICGVSPINFGEPNGVCKRLDYKTQRKKVIGLKNVESFEEYMCLKTETLISAKVLVKFMVILGDNWRNSNVGPPLPTLPHGKYHHCNLQQLTHDEQNLGKNKITLYKNTTKNYVNTVATS